MENFCKTAEVTQSVSGQFPPKNMGELSPGADYGAFVELSSHTCIQTCKTDILTSEKTQ